MDHEQRPDSTTEDLPGSPPPRTDPDDRPLAYMGSRRSWNTSRTRHSKGLQMRILALAIVTFCGWILTLLPSDYELDQQMRVPLSHLPGYNETTTTDGLKPTSKQREEVSTTSPPVVPESPPTTSTPTTSTTTPPGRGARCGEWALSASKAGWPAEWVDILLDDIIWDESRCQPDATNGFDHGLAQINWTTWGDYVESFGFTKADLYIPEINLWIALQIAHKADAAGWRWCQPWDSSQVRRCS